MRLQWQVRVPYAGVSVESDLEQWCVDTRPIYLDSNDNNNTKRFIY